MGIGIATEDARLYYLLVRELKSLGLPFESFRVEEKIPAGILVIITSERERSRLRAKQKVIAVKSLEDVSKAIAEARMVLLGKEGSFRELLVGIDPGKNIGVAIVADGEFLEGKVFRDVDSAVSYVKQAVERYPAAKSFIKIGVGSPEYEELAFKVSSEVKGVQKVVLVDESGSGRGLEKFKGLPRDVVSAISIAMREGRQRKRRVP
ncbi:MAG TPA: hypothetical protein ENF82_00805 [Candidatus Methanomethylia archaeon]|nr:hypothetical protein [Candidatus Methanomethylicia archaeon]